MSEAIREEYRRLHGDAVVSARQLLAALRTEMGRSGKDMLTGGPGHDILIGGAAGDRLIGGSGSDWMFDSKGPTVVRTGRYTGEGTDVVNVRDGRDDDLVYCESRKILVYADRGDRVVGHCGRVVHRGRLLRMPG